ncbi:hypothetical protein WICPIJ_004041 [Wickerhamomyces pijperi]|uniref:Uncharacterized protein n=1 Tax=Wickerhamomyces pijperi TaxID=599730 RepID=A0A9P8TNB3_WICPI|nr:hypothetical protein WICPIJ_004041 [Wickerhamomyces pijperi]
MASMSQPLEAFCNLGPFLTLSKKVISSTRLEALFAGSIGSGIPGTKVEEISSISLRLGGCGSSLALEVWISTLLLPLVALLWLSLPLAPPAAGGEKLPTGGNCAWFWAAAWASAAWASPVVSGRNCLKSSNKSGASWNKRVTSV